MKKLCASSAIIFCLQARWPIILTHCNAFSKKNNPNLTLWNKVIDIVRYFKPRKCPQFFAVGIFFAIEKSLDICPNFSF